MFNIFRNIILTCTVFGFMFFVCNLESPDMGNIIFRNGQFAPWNVWEYIVSPFKQDVLWYPQLWAANWIITTSLGTVIGLLASIVVSMLCYLWGELEILGRPDGDVGPTRWLSERMGKLL